MTINRRTLLAASLAAVPVAHAFAAGAPEETLRLWPGDAPGTLPASPTGALKTGPAGGTYNLRQPTLRIYRPARPTGAAMLVIPGGGYARLMLANEGDGPAAWLTAHGITAAVLNYRLPGEGWRDPANTPLADAQRAMRLIRANAARWGVQPDQVGVVGFSAGGHLCGDLATRFDRRVYPPIDAADRLSARPMLAAPIYPVVSMEADVTHAGSRQQLIGESATEAMVTEHSVDRQVTRDTPPLFVAHAADDVVVKVDNSLMLYAAARAAGVPIEMHLYERGGHGFGMTLRPAPDRPAAAWTGAFRAWAGLHGLKIAPPA